MDLDLRDLRYFVAVAEQLHFSRAAEQLHLDQPTLSRHVRRLEQKLGVDLLERTTRTVALTPAGRALLAKARETLVSAGAAVDAAQRAAAGEVGVLRVGMMAQIAADLRTAAFRAFQERYPDVGLRPRSYPFADPSCGLVSRETDAAFVWLPVEHPAIEHALLYAEQRVFVLAEEHPLAARRVLTLEDVEDEPFFRLAGMADDPLVAAWNDFWQLQPRPDGRRRATGAEVATEEEWLDALTRGLAISTTAASASTFYPWPGVTYVPAEGISPAPVAIAWRREPANATVTNFVRLVRELGDEKRGRAAHGGSSSRSMTSRPT